MLFLPEAPDGGLDVPGLDKVVHLGLFALLALTARWRFGRRARVVATVLAYAVVSELVQATLLAHRGGDILDLLADIVGALGGWAAADGLRRITSGSVGSTSADDDSAEDWAIR